MDPPGVVESEFFTKEDLVSEFRRLGIDLKQSLQAHLQDVLRSELSTTTDTIRAASKLRTPSKASLSPRDAPVKKPGSEPNIDGSKKFEAAIAAVESADYDDELPLFRRGFLATKAYDGMAAANGLTENPGHQPLHHKHGDVKHRTASLHGLDRHAAAADQRHAVQKKTKDSVRSLPADQPPTPTHQEKQAPPPEEDCPVMDVSFAGSPLRDTAQVDGVTEYDKSTDLDNEHDQNPEGYGRASSSTVVASENLKEAWGGTSSRRVKKASVFSNLSKVVDQPATSKYDLRAAKHTAMRGRPSMLSPPAFAGTVSGDTVEFQNAYSHSLRGSVRKHAWQIVDTTLFSTVTTGAIILYSFVIAIQTEWLARNLDEDPHVVFKVTEVIFCLVFTFEVCMRVLAYGVAYFYEESWMWNIFDMILVAFQILDLIIISVLEDDSSDTNTNMSFMRILRVVRLVRVMRLVQVVRLMSELRTMLSSIMTSLKSLCFTLVLVFCLVFMMGVFMTQIVSDTLRSNLNQHNLRHDLRYFRTLDISCLVLFQSLTGGVDWAEPLEPVIEHISPAVGVVYCLYISFGVLCMLNVITGVFVEQACNSSAEERDANLVSRLQHFLGAHTECGVLTWDNFAKSLDDPELQLYFKTADLDVSEAEGLFKLLDADDSGTVEAEEFVMGCLRLRGNAKAVDLATLMYENRRWHRRIDRLTRKVDGTLNEFYSRLSQICLA